MFSQLFELFRPKAFDIDFPQKVFNGVFELPLLRNAQKRHKKTQKLKKKKKEVPTYPILSSARYTSLSILFFFGAPRARPSSGAARRNKRHGAERHRASDGMPPRLGLARWQHVGREGASTASAGPSELSEDHLKSFELVSVGFN